MRIGALFALVAGGCWVNSPPGGSAAVPPPVPPPAVAAAPAPAPADPSRARALEVAPVQPVGGPVAQYGQVPWPAPVQPRVAPAASGGQPPGYRTVTGTTGSPWSFAVPARWQEVPPPLPGIIIAIRDTEQTTGLYPNVNLVTEPYAFGDGAMYASANLGALSQAAVIVAQRPANVGSLTGADIEARWITAVPPYRTVQRYTAAAGLGYVLTCTGADSTFEVVRPTCDAILNSFRVMP